MKEHENSLIIKYRREDENYYSFEGLPVAKALEYANRAFADLGVIKGGIERAQCVAFKPWLVIDKNARGFIAPFAAQDAGEVTRAMTSRKRMDDGVAMAVLRTGGCLTAYFKDTAVVADFVSFLADFAVDEERFFERGKSMCIYGAGNEEYCVIGKLKKRGRGRLRMYDAADSRGDIGDIELEKEFRTRIKDVGRGMLAAFGGDISEKLKDLEASKEYDILEISDYDMLPQRSDGETDIADRTAAILKKGTRLDKRSMTELLFLHNCGYCDKANLGENVCALVRIYDAVNAVYCVNDVGAAKDDEPCPADGQMTVMRIEGDEDIRDTELARYELSKVLDALAEQGRTVYLTQPNGLFFTRNERGLMEVPSDMTAKLFDYLDEAGTFAFVVLKDGYSPNMLSDEQMRELLYAGGTAAQDMKLTDALHMLYRVHDLYYGAVIAVRP